MGLGDPKPVICSFCGKPAPRYRTSALNAHTVQYHCFRWTCRFKHWLDLQIHNYYRRKK